MLTRFSHVMLFVTDLDRAVAWYGQHLGFEPRFVVPGQYASLHNKAIDVRLDLHPTETAGRDVGFGPMPYFAVEHMDTFLATLKSAGVRAGEPRREGGSTRFVTIWDSEGNAIGLEEVPVAGV